MEYMTSIVPTQAKPVEWDKELQGARMLMKSGLLPSGVKSAEAALFIILTGRDLGLSPIQSLRSINVIQGKVEVAADMSLGLFHRAGGKSHFVKLTDTEAVLRFSAPWLIEDHEESFTIKDAERAGLLSRQDNWKKFPKAMLRSRAITAGLKSIGFDPTAGIYDYGEISGVEHPVQHDGGGNGIAVVAEVEPNVAEISAEEIIETQEREALSEVEAILPELAENQQEWVKGKLSEGAPARALLGALKKKLAESGEASR